MGNSIIFCSWQNHAVLEDNVKKRPPVPPGAGRVGFFIMKDLKELFIDL
jgi:hypothetical protein